MIFRHTRLIMGTALLAVALPAVPAMAQDADEARIKKLEAEVRALQRKVFPGGDGRYFEPQIDSSAPVTTTSSSPASTTAVTDILARLDALEASLQRLTGQVEVNSNAVRDLESRLAALESGAAPAVAADNLLPDEQPLPAAAGPAPTPPPAPAASGPSAQRLAAVQAIAKPQTDDPGDDEYSYGFRLWNAGFYPEAQQQLAMFVEKYPRHPRATYGRNLLGRAYLDDGKPREAAPWFLKNYQEDRNAERAPDSLLYLAESMIALGDTNRACIALAEFGETYPAIAAGRLSNQYEANRKKVTCN
ncbi:hypothetical protein LY632_13320 [Erythrobacter sp. SDW2]|uniref:tetratricopeptide repeat protein n=1 Tax=Erythrobacter sp. SDW2 TaxID=2907154 RepID=UPI001F43CA38|nr:tetratricopeptide repeat protein [Erythrobacter sp. SDW2]UIP06647.1 hypothetical protein LY632_13320 [Erythrobacter sp. SDW2]